MFNLFGVPNFIKIRYIAVLRPNLPKFLISGHDPQFQISYLWLTDLTGVPNFIALGIHFTFGTKFSWNKKVDTYFNVKCLLLARNFNFLSGYLVVTTCYLVVPGGYCSLHGGYYSLPFIPTFSMNGKHHLSSWALSSYAIIARHHMWWCENRICLLGGVCFTILQHFWNGLLKAMVHPEASTI